ncbi:PspC domain-containing protein [Sinobaca qinghaiensis]|uniref:Phage shock protein C (PspC) family protein n=1 Tax=Sinobaca qinghaiensis TaxID=342944 RepID=A0A419V9F9_9BACL|nr:phage shock protein C (PspC) family protein [Sinobaca qinghaiensis]
MKKKLYRSETDKMLAGICGGLADYLNVNTTLVRVSTVILSLLTSGVPIIILYIVLAFVLPKEGSAS